MKKIFLITIISTILFANIDLKKEVIQVGVFKNQKSIDKIKNALKKYDIYIKKYPNKLQKIFVINIKEKEFEQTLSEIKKIASKAFKLSLKRKLELIKSDEPKDWLNNTLADNNKTKKLDSKAIIKTRNKFFQ
jgi:hypothetical protein